MMVSNLRNVPKFYKVSSYFYEKKIVYFFSFFFYLTCTENRRNVLCVHFTRALDIVLSYNSRSV